MRFLVRALFTIAFLGAVTAAANAATVSGVVTSAATGNALGGMVVAAYDPAGNLAGTATTDETGFYVLTLPPGEYRLLAYDFTGVYATTFDANAESFETSPLRSISASGAQVSFALVNGGTIAGSVQTNSGAPRANAVVEAYNLSGTRRGFTTTNAAGEYSLVLPPREYKVIAYDVNGTYAASFYAGVRSFAEATPVAVTESASTPVSFSLDPAARVSGKTVDAAAGAALASILVYAFTPAGAIVAATETDATGTFRFSLPAGDYRFVAADDARVYATAYYDRSMSFTASNVVVLAAGQQWSNAQIALTRGARVRGHVNAPSLVIGAYNADGTLHASATSDAAGNYTLVVVPGEYRIAVSDPALTFATLFYGGVADFRAAQRLQVIADVNGIDVTLPRGGRVSGTVRNNITEQPVAGITVGAYDDAGALVTSATTGIDGRHALVVAPGAYRLVAFDPALNFATAYAGGASSYETTGPLFVEVDARITADFTIRRGVRVRGSVTTPLGASANGVEVFAIDASGNRVAGAVTNDGAFTVVVAPGTYRFIAVDPSRRYAPAGASNEVTIVQGQTPAPIALMLEAAARRRAVRH